MNYEDFLHRKRQLDSDAGFEPLWMPDFLFPFQRHLVEWAIRRGRAAVLADCGLGKTPMQLVWAENVWRKTRKPVLLLTPLAVGAQTVREGEKFNIECKQSRDGKVAAQITITNYEKLHLFNPEDYSACICDESSILKHFSGATQKDVTRFMCKMIYRSLWTATAAPNDYIELGTSSEALGGLTHTDMLGRFFRYLDDKGQKRERRDQLFAEKSSNHFAKLSFRVHQTIGQWRLKHHAKESFWRWICSWAMACRKPSDLGYDDNGFVLPPLREQDHIIFPSSPPSGYLFTLPACGLKDERDERRRTMTERCEFVAKLADHQKPVVVWCHLNQEGDELEKTIPGSKQVSGATPEDEKEETYKAFSDGSLRVLILKPKMGAWGLNWQHCAHVITFASHSYEQFYQSVRRCWRFGQKSPVQLDVIATEGERGVIANMRRKEAQADHMFSALVAEMNCAQSIKRGAYQHETAELPQWI